MNVAGQATGVGSDTQGLRAAPPACVSAGAGPASPHRTHHLSRPVAQTGTAAALSPTASCPPACSLLPVHSLRHGGGSGSGGARRRRLPRPLPPLAHQAPQRNPGPRRTRAGGSAAAATRGAGLGRAGGRAAQCRGGGAPAHRQPGRRQAAVGGGGEQQGGRVSGGCDEGLGDRNMPTWGWSGMGGVSIRLPSSRPCRRRARQSSAIPSTGRVCVALLSCVSADTPPPQSCITS